MALNLDGDFIIAASEELDQAEAVTERVGEHGDLAQTSTRISARRARRRRRLRPERLRYPRRSRRDAAESNGDHNGVYRRQRRANLRVFAGGKGEPATAQFGDLSAKTTRYRQAKRLV